MNQGRRVGISIANVDGVARIGFARPEKKNALTGDMYARLAQAVMDAEADDTIAALLLHGDRQAFTAGNDLEDFLANPPGPDAPVFDFMQALSTARKPVVASVNGMAVGIGTTMLLHCDLVYLADDALLVMPFVKLGLCPEFAASRLVPARIGHARAAEALLLSEPIRAADALAMGLATRLLPPDDVFGFACAQAARFAHLPPTAVRETKRLMKQGDAAGVARQIQDEATVFADLLHSDEARAAFKAFLNRPR